MQILMPEKKTKTTDTFLETGYKLHKNIKNWFHAAQKKIIIKIWNERKRMSMNLREANDRKWILQMYKIA